ncbi:MAG: LLM class flavin-dependent oxidoreductase [Gemmobacter sp.]
MALELGLDTFGDVTNGPDGQPQPHAAVLREVVEQGVAADQAGVDVISLGEHHRADFAISSPETVLAAIAARTTRIRLGSGVTVLSSDDPIRVFQRFSTLDAVSQGRAEVIVGRGSFIESFPLFGHDLDDYERLFAEKLDLFTHLIRQPRVTWSGTIHPGLHDQPVFPPTEAPLRTWIGVGGSPESVVRAARYTLPLMLAIIGGPASRFRPYVDLYHRAHGQAGTEPQPIGVHSPGHVAETDARAREQYWAGYKAMHDTIGRERGWPPITPADFLREVEHGAMYVGSPETVARKIAATVTTLGLSRFQLKYSAGPVAHAHSMQAIRLYGERVMPMVRDML